MVLTTKEIKKRLIAWKREHLPAFSKMGRAQLIYTALKFAVIKAEELTEEEIKSNATYKPPPVPKAEPRKLAPEYDTFRRRVLNRMLKDSLTHLQRTSDMYSDTVLVIGGEEIHLLKAEAEDLKQLKTAPAAAAKPKRKAAESETQTEPAPKKHAAEIETQTEAAPPAKETFPEKSPKNEIISPGKEEVKKEMNSANEYRPYFNEKVDFMNIPEGGKELYNSYLKTRNEETYKLLVSYLMEHTIMGFGDLIRQDPNGTNKVFSILPQTRENVEMVLKLKVSAYDDYTKREEEASARKAQEKNEGRQLLTKVMAQYEKTKAAPTPANIKALQKGFEELWNEEYDFSEDAEDDSKRKKIVKLLANGLGLTKLSSFDEDEQRKMLRGRKLYCPTCLSIRRAERYSSAETCGTCGSDEQMTKWWIKQKPKTAAAPTAAAAPTEPAKTKSEPAEKGYRVEQTQLTEEGFTLSRSHAHRVFSKKFGDDVWKKLLSLARVSNKGNVIIQLPNTNTSQGSDFEALVYDKDKIAEINNRNPIEKPTAKRPPQLTQEIQVFRYQVCENYGFSGQDTNQLLTKERYLRGFKGHHNNSEADWKRLTKSAKGDVITLPQVMTASGYYEMYPELEKYLESKS